MAWLEVHQELREHRKLYACADDLGVEPVTMLGMLVSLWLWALDNVQDGNLAGISNRSVARAAKWPEKKADKLMAALISNGWIDQDGETLSIHDWAEYTGRLMDRRKSDAERKRKKREERKQKESGTSAEQTGTSAGCPPDVQRTSAACPDKIRCYSNSNSTISPNGDITVPTTPSPSAPPGGRATDNNGPDGPAAPAVDYKAIQDMYNTTCISLPRCRTLSDARKKAIHARLRAGYTPDDFQALFAKAEASAFLKGSNKRNWSADFDWLIADANMAKVLDGKYDSQTQGHQEQPQTNNPFLRMLQEEGEL